MKDNYPDERYNELRKAGIIIEKREDFTCNKCMDVLTCEFAWDLYNINENCVCDK